MSRFSFGDTHRSAVPEADAVPLDTEPVVIVEPGLIERGHDVIRDEEDTDAEYESRRELFALIIDAARKP